MLGVRRYAFILLVAILLPLGASAHGGVYFEYAPDPWRSFRLAVSTVATPYQFFQSATDFTLNGFDLWVDNTGSGGPVTFTLLDEQNTTLAEKTITLSTTPAIPGGSKLHIDLDTSVTISHYQTYAIQISSTLPGFGLYYANRINILEHNLNYTTEYALGVAQLGTEKQSFTFKFALHDPDVVTNNEDPGQPQATSTPGVTETVISNARVTNITDTTAIAAWTTNVAADSRVSIRSQLNPLYIYTTAYDPTLELEHALLITGLVPNVGYYADFFSQQTPDEPILTTYSVAFRTLDGQGATPPPTTPPTTPPPTTPPPTTPPTTPPATPPTTGTSSSTPGPGGNEGQASSTTTQGTTLENTNPPSFGDGSGINSFSVGWDTPTNGAPNGGYRIDIFDADNRLVRQLRAPSDATTRNIAALPEGEYSTIVYADRDGVYTKVAAPAPFNVAKKRSPLFWFWYSMGVVLALGAGVAFLFSRREKTALPKIDES